MRLAVLADDAGAVGDERHGQVLQADVVDDLVERSLEEGRVDRDERRQAIGSHAGRHAHGVLLGNADVEDAVGVLRLHLDEAGAFQHGRADADDRLVVAHDPGQGLGEHLRVGGRAGARP